MSSSLALAFIASSCLIQIVNSGAVADKYSCPHGWTRYGTRKCLKYVNELQDYDRAQTTCRTKNQGTLVTVHSHDEQNFVYSYIHSIAASSTPIWLGAKQIDFESILWLDKTENSYTNWAPSEPSHPDEICIAINPRNGMWRDVMCTEANVPACERAPTTQWPFFVPFCSEGWFQFNDEKCVRILSSQALNFYESQELCRSKYNSKLLSIKSDKESEFLHNLIKFRDVKLPVWLGAVQNDFSSFNWIDKSDVTFTNWAEGEPNDPDHACLSMAASSGKWSDNDCKEQKLILCQKVVPEDSSCETGWLQFRQDKCYRFVHIKLAFDDAESLCNNLYGGHLPSIHSQEEQFMISQFLASVNVKNGSEIWLGGRQMDFHNFNWADGSLFNYSYWDNGEPNFPAEKCIEMSWRNGRWNDINCRLKRAVLCERQVSSRHQLTKPNLYQPTTCLESNCTNYPTTAATSQQGGLIQETSTPHQHQQQYQPQHLVPEESPTDPTAGVFLNVNNATSFETTTYAADNSTNSILASAPSAAASSTANSTTGSEVAAESAFVEDKPIKVIASIMHRPSEQHTVVDPLVSLHNSSVGDLVAATIGGGSNGTFVHYNLPPPGSIATADHLGSNGQETAHESLYSGGESSQLTGKRDAEPLYTDQPVLATLADLIQKTTQQAATSKPTMENPPLSIQTTDQTPAVKIQSTTVSAVASTNPTTAAGNASTSVMMAATSNSSLPSTVAQTK